MSLAPENRNKQALYKWAVSVGTIVLATVTATVTTLTFLKQTVSEGVTDGIATVIKDVDYLKKEVDDHKKELADLRTIVTNHQTAIAVLEVNLKNTTERVSVRYIDKDFMKPEEPEVKTRAPKRK